MNKTTFRALLAAALFIACGALSLPGVAQTNSGNLSAVILPSASRTATDVNSADITNAQWRGGHFIINISTYSAGTYTPTIQGKDPVSGTYYSLLVGNAISSTGTTVLKIYPGAAPIVGGIAADVLPRVFRVKMSASATTPVTYSVGAFFVQ